VLQDDSLCACNLPAGSRQFSDPVSGVSWWVLSDCKATSHVALPRLKRRNVFRVAIAYLALAWLLTEVAGTVFPVFGIPDWGVRFVVIVFALGFLPALIISWVYELTPEGIKRETDAGRNHRHPGVPCCP